MYMCVVLILQRQIHVTSIVMLFRVAASVRTHRASTCILHNISRNSCCRTDATISSWETWINCSASNPCRQPPPSIHSYVVLLTDHHSLCYLFFTDRIFTSSDSDDRVSSITTSLKVNTSPLLYCQEQHRTSDIIIHSRRICSPDIRSASAFEVFT